MKRGTEEVVALRHGAGGAAMRRLIQEVLIRDLETLPFEGIGIAAMDDGAALRVGDRWLVLTTDSHVVQPPFFPGGDIGRLAVCGTVNDLAMMGATEVLALTCAVVLEAGFSLADLERIQSSMVEACREAVAPIVTGDTKVMGSGELDGIILNTTGIGFAHRLILDSGLMPGDRIIVTGNVGEHGLAVMVARHELDFEGELVSDVAPVGGLIHRALVAAEPHERGVTAMKDPTRGGLAGALHEMAAKGKVGVLLEESSIPITPQAAAVGELLGIDPLHVANEGKAVLGVDPAVADKVLAALRDHPLGRKARIIGRSIPEHRGRVILQTGFGRRLLAEPQGELLPRIC